MKPIGINRYMPKRTTSSHCPAILFLFWHWSIGTREERRESARVRDG